MQAAVISAFGEVEGLTVQTVEQPRPEPDMVLIKVEASGVGFADTLTRRGLYPPGLKSAGVIPGGDAVGRVVSVGTGKEYDLGGRRVYAFTGLGAHAEFVNAPLANVIPLAENVDPIVAAAFGVNSIVSQVALARAGVGTDTNVLIRGAAGGVGLAAVRLAQMSGAKVLATASTPERAAYLEKLGVRRVLDRMGRLPNGERPECDVVIDPVGGSEVPSFISMLAINGRYVFMGAAGGLPGPDFGAALLANFFKSLSFSTLSLHAVPMAARLATLSNILAAHQAGKLAADIHAVISLQQLQDVHRQIEAGGTLGKVVLAF